MHTGKVFQNCDGSCEDNKSSREKADKSDESVTKPGIKMSLSGKSANSSLPVVRDTNVIDETSEESNKSNEAKPADD